MKKSNKTVSCITWCLIIGIFAMISGVIYGGLTYDQADCFDRYMAESIDPEGMWNATFTELSLEQPAQIVCAPPTHHIISPHKFGPYKVLDWMVRHGWSREKAHAHLARTGIIPPHPSRDLRVDNQV